MLRRLHPPPGLLANRTAQNREPAIAKRNGAESTWVPCELFALRLMSPAQTELGYFPRAGSQDEMRIVLFSPLISSSDSPSPSTASVSCKSQARLFTRFPVHLGRPFIICSFFGSPHSLSVFTIAILSRRRHETICYCSTTTPVKLLETASIRSFINPIRACLTSPGTAVESASHSFMLGYTSTILREAPRYTAP